VASENKTIITWLPNGENRVILQLLVLTHKRTDNRRLSLCRAPAYNIAERDTHPT